MHPARSVRWHGTQQESIELIAAVSRNCACRFGPMGVRLATCALHRMLVEDQGTLDRLLFYRRLRERLVREEMAPPG